MSFSFRRFFLLVGNWSTYLLAIVIGVGGTYLWLRSAFYAPLIDDRAAEKSFVIEGGQNMKQIARNLESQEFVRSWWPIYWLYRIKKEPPTIPAGEFLISPGYSPAEILEQLIAGKIVYYQVAIPEGTTIDMLPPILERTSLVTAENVRATMKSDALLAELGIPANSLEGYVFPETYKFSRPTTARQMLIRMVTEGRKRVTDEMIERTIDLGFSFHQILTLASIIEKETGKAEDRAKISSVFHNRLRIGMPMQSDPTVIYGIEDFDGNLTKEHLRTPGPYNTYLNTGLPPTPIANPGLESIKAALYPDDTDFLYFVARGDGSSQFSATLREHNNAVNKYQRRRKAKKAAAQAEKEAAAAQ